MADIRHAGLIARRIDGRWLGVLIEGASGAGKSDLALRALDQGFRLVADDRVLVWSEGGRLFGRAPDPLRGLMEVRGFGIVREEPVAFAEIGLVANLGAPERLPDLASEAIVGVNVPLMVASAFDLSTPAKLGRALEAFDATHNRRI